jgi:hypothetical protein
MFLPALLLGLLIGLITAAAVAVTAAVRRHRRPHGADAGDGPSEDEGAVGVTILLALLLATIAGWILAVWVTTLLALGASAPALIVASALVVALALLGARGVLRRDDAGPGVTADQDPEVRAILRSVLTWWLVIAAVVALLILVARG